MALILYCDNFSHNFDYILKSQLFNLWLRSGHFDFSLKILQCYDFIPTMLIELLFFLHGTKTPSYDLVSNILCDIQD